MIEALMMLLTSTLAPLNLPVYAEDAVPPDAPFPFVTFRAEPSAAPFGDGALTLTCWCRGESAHAQRTRAADHLLRLVPTAGLKLPIPTGLAILHRSDVPIQWLAAADALAARVCHRLHLCGTAP